MTAPPFPLGPTPSYYATCSFPTRNGVFIEGQAVTITLSKAGATAWHVRDYSGQVVGGGSANGTTVTPTRTDGQPWAPGWYRLYLTQAVNDAVFGTSAGATNFVVIRDDPRFPPIPEPGVSGGSGNEARDLVLKGFMGVGTSRLSIMDIDDLTAGSDPLTVVVNDTQIALDWWADPAHEAYADPARPRLLWTNFVETSCDYLGLNDTGGSWGAVVYPATAELDSAALTVTVTAGTSSGSKVTAALGGTTEVFDNIAHGTALQTATANATLIRAFARNTTALAAMSATAIGSTRSGNVTATVQALYPHVTRYEGPSNEPTLSSRGVETAHQQRLFHGAVKAGHPDAVALGPCPVDVVQLTGWAAFLAAGGGTWCDEIAFHDYTSMIGSDGNLFRRRTQAFLDLLDTYGQGDKVLWQTEAGEALTSVSGVYAPRRARVGLLHTLLWEQYGIPRERNPRWYDRSHGFWSFPAWLIMGDGSLNPQVPMFRVLAEETFGTTHAEQLDLGIVGNRVFAASRFAREAADVIVAQAFSAMPDASLTFTVTGATSLTTVDCFGIETVVPVVNDRVTLPVSDTPSYLRLPTGATATLHHCNDWPPSQYNNTGHSTSYLSGQRSIVDLNDGRGLTDWTGYGANPGMALGTGLPDHARLTFDGPTRVDRVILWCGIARQQGSVPLDFDVQTSDDGTTWTARATVTRTPSSFLHGSNSTNAGCQRETFWDEQWIYDVPFDVPVTCSHVRVYVRDASYGGMPDALTGTVSNFGDGGTPALALQDIAVICDANARPQIVVAT